MRFSDQRENVFHNVYFYVIVFYVIIAWHLTEVVKKDQLDVISGAPVLFIILVS